MHTQKQESSEPESGGQSCQTPASALIVPPEAARAAEHAAAALGGRSGRGGVRGADWIFCASGPKIRNASACGSERCSSQPIARAPSRSLQATCAASLRSLRSLWSSSAATPASVHLPTMPHRGHAKLRRRRRCSARSAPCSARGAERLPRRRRTSAPLPAARAASKDTTRCLPIGRARSFELSAHSALRCATAAESSHELGWSLRRGAGALGRRWRSLGCARKAAHRYPYSRRFTW